MQMHPVATLDTLHREAVLAVLNTFYRATHEDKGTGYMKGDALVNIQGHDAVFIGERQDGSTFAIQLTYDPRCRFMHKANGKDRPWLDVQQKAGPKGALYTQVRLTNEGKRVRFRLYDLCATAGKEVNPKLRVMNPAKEGVVKP